MRLLAIETSTPGASVALVEDATTLAAASRIDRPAALAERIRTELSAVGISNPKAEIDAFFEDPDGHAADLQRRIVPGLVARAEEAPAAQRLAHADEFHGQAELLLDGEDCAAFGGAVELGQHDAGALHRF